MKRRTFLALLAGLGAAGAGAFALLRPNRANAYYAGPVSDHFDGMKFFNPGGDPPRGLGDLLRWRFGEASATWPASFPSPLPPAKPQARITGDAPRVTFIGHASFLVQVSGVNLLIDPVYADRASPVRFAGPLRANPPGIAFDDLPRIDGILVSHNHYDHLDTTTIHRLWDRDRPRIIAPLGNGSIIQAGRSEIIVESGDWGDAFRLDEALTVTLEPSQHWSARGINDRSHALWASFVLETAWGKLWAVGDTGFGEGRVFQRIRARHPIIRAGLIPIGAYEPRWFMRQQHINPAEAVEIFRLLGLEHALGYHWGTFKLANERVDQPPADLAIALRDAGIEASRFPAAVPGMVWQAA